MKNHSTIKNSQILDAFDQADTCQENLETIAELLLCNNSDEAFNRNVAGGVGRLIKAEMRKLRNALDTIEAHYPKLKSAKVSSAKK
jgi:hypothetical protein